MIGQLCRSSFHLFHLLPFLAEPLPAANKLSGMQPEWIARAGSYNELMLAGMGGTPDRRMGGQFSGD